MYTVSENGEEGGQGLGGSPPGQDQEEVLAERAGRV